MRLRNQFLGIACLTAAAQACALTLGTPQNPVVLGAPLDVRITIVPDPGQTLDSSCIQAQVMQGEVFTPVRTTLSPHHLDCTADPAHSFATSHQRTPGQPDGQRWLQRPNLAQLHPVCRPPAAAAKHATRRRVVAKPSPRKNRQAPGTRP